jgi:signal transduction histidine kinase
MDSDVQSEEKRVLLVAPTVRDGEITRSLLAKAGLTCVVCQSLYHLVNELHVGAGALLLTEETITGKGITELLTTVDKQPSWSDLPVVMMMRQGDQSPVATGVLRSLGKRELQEQLEIAIDASELGTFHCDMPLDKIVWNARCKTHFWLPQDAEIDFDLFYSILHPDDRERTREAIEACVYGGKVYDIEYRTVSPRGELRWIRATGRTYYKEEKPVRFDGTTQDITDRKRVDEERKQLFEIERSARVEAERTSRMKDEFLATLSHELRTPLNAILGWTQLLKRDQQDPEMLSEAISVIERNARAQTQLIEDLLDMSRIISGNVRLDVRQVELSEMINAAMESVKPTAETKGVRLEKVIDRLVGSISGDPARLQQVLWNLLTNAIKFTPKGGKVHVFAKVMQSHVEISVADTGEGISPGFLPHLFERFSQADGSAKRKHRGLGLGLSIVKNLVEMHGGAVRANSRGQGQGATFIIHLPLQAPKSSEGEENPPPTRMSLSGVSVEYGRPNLRGIKVLVVEDEADARELLRRFLVESDALPALAASAAEAQKLLFTFKPDVIVSDIGMPHTDGYELIRDVRKQGLTTPAVALSAYARAEDRIRSAQTGYQTHLAKPVDPAELLAIIASLAGRYERTA